LENYAEGTVRVLALASRRGRVEGRFDDLPISMGDVIVLSGERAAMRQLAAECGMLALSPRRSTGRRHNAAAGVGIFALGVAATALEILPAQMAFGGVVLALVLARQLNLRTALQDVNWGIVILL